MALSTATAAADRKSPRERGGGASHHLHAFVDRRRDPDGKREAVLRVAVQLFLERGFWRTSLTEVADKLKITKPALYHYFHNKEDIYLECYRRGMSLIRANIERLRADASSGLEKVAGFIYLYATVIATDFGRFVVRQDDRELSPDARQEVRAYKRQVDRALREFIQNGIDDGTVRVCDSKLAAFSIAGAVNSMAVWFDPEKGRSASEIAREFARILTQGLAQKRRAAFRLPELEWEGI
jgi:AcrR family transcriptional regulator